MRVLVVIAEMGVGGAETVVASLAGDLLASGGRVTVASQGGWRADELATDGARLLHIPLRGRRALDVLRAVRIVRRELAGRSAELIHAHNVKAAAVAYLAGYGRPRVPIIVTLHGIPGAEYATAARVLSRCADRVVAVSGHVARSIVQAGLPAERVSVIENAVRPPAAADRHAVRAALGIGEDVRVVLCAARFTAQKRHDLLIEAWPDIAPDALLLLAGDGPARPAIEAAIIERGLSAQVRLLGERRDVDYLLAAADVFVLPTDWEGLPVSLLEAMAAGVPVVASAVGGIVDSLDGAACLVAPNSAEALADGLNRVLADVAIQRELADAGRQLIRSRFSAPRMFQSYREVYGAVPDEKRTAR